MARSKAARRRLALIRLVVVGALVFGILHNLLAIHNKKQKALARSIADRVVANSQLRAVSASRTTTFDSGSSDTTFETPTASTARDPIVPPVTSSTPPAPSTASPSSTSSVPIRIQRGGAVYIPVEWGDKHRSVKAGRPVDCAERRGHSDEGGRITNPIAPIYTVSSSSSSSCATAETIPGLCEALTALLPQGQGDDPDTKERAVLLAFAGGDVGGGNGAPRDAVQVATKAAPRRL